MGNAVQKLRARLVMERARAHGLPSEAAAAFRPERSRSPEARKSSTGSSSSSSSSNEDEDEWTSAQEDESSSSSSLEDPLSDLLARTSDDDFMRAVLSFCSYMDGRMETLDNSRIYDEFRSYTACGPFDLLPLA